MTTQAAGMAVARPAHGRVWALLTAGAVMACSLTALTVTGQLATSADGPALKAYHPVLAALGLILLARQRLVRWRPEMTLYFVAFGAASLLAYLSFTPRPVFANLLIAAYAATIGAALGHAARPALVVRACRATAAVLLCVVLAKAVLHRDAILNFLAAPNGHPTLPTVYGGGVNIEATLTALGATFFLGSLLLWPYLALSLLLSAMYASRAGIITAVAVLALAIWRAVQAAPHGSPQRRRLLLTLTVLAVGGSVTAGGALAAMGDTMLTAYVLDRFSNVGEDPGSMGRLALWSGGVDVFLAHPFGVGFGNAVPEIARIAGRFLHEDNLHNQYLQHFVEGGVAGGIAFLALAAVTWRRLARSGGRDPLLAYLGIYFLLALLQFRGAEALLWLVFGLQHGASVAPLSVDPRSSPPTV